MKYRIENDSIGKVNVPVDAYFGSQTIRASQNFPLSNFIFQKSFINAIVLIKLSAAKANMELKLLNETKAKAIIAASSEIINGKFSDQFIVDVFQTGSGTSTNMNVNEVISNRAIEILGGKKGDKTLIHPNDDVNMGQSTNDVFPTAIHIAVSNEVKNNLLPSLNKLHLSLNSKSIEFQNIIKSGRTHFQDAVPITLGQEFNGYTIMIKKSIRRIEKSLPDLNELPILLLAFDAILFNPVFASLNGFLRANPTPFVTIPKDPKTANLIAPNAARAIVPKPKVFNAIRPRNTASAPL